MAIQTRPEVGDLVDRAEMPQVEAEQDASPVGPGLGDVLRATSEVF
jgi:hypothetical protein